MSLVLSISSENVVLENQIVKELLVASLSKDDRKTATMAQRLINAYYMKSR
jgi:hypothetical protein